MHKLGFDGAGNPSTKGSPRCEVQLDLRKFGVGARSRISTQLPCILKDIPWLWLSARERNENVPSKCKGGMPGEFSIVCVKFISLQRGGKVSL